MLLFNFYKLCIFIVMFMYSYCYICSVLYTPFSLCCSKYCLCVNVYCHRVTTQLQLTNIYHIIYRIIYQFPTIIQKSFHNTIILLYTYYITEEIYHNNNSFIQYIFKTRKLKPTNPPYKIFKR